MSLQQVTHMWKIINIQLSDAWIKLNDKDRIPFSDENDERLAFSTDMSFKLMDSCKHGDQIKSPTGETSYTLHVTLGIVDVMKTLLCLEFRYVLPGKIPSDRIEGEF